MQQRSDDRLIAYLDGELEVAQRREVEAWLDADPAARQRMAALAESANLLRLAFDEAIREPVPDRLVAAARGETSPSQAGAQILPFRRRAGARIVAPRVWRIGLPVAASLLGLLVGSGIAYLGAGKLALDGIAGKQAALETTAANNLWLDNAAGYFKLVVSAGDSPPVDIPATGDPREALQKISQSLPQEVRLPDLKPWGLSFRGARLAEGRSAIKEMARKIVEIEDMTTDDCTFSVGVIHGGQWVNCVSTTCTGEALSMAKRQEDLDWGVAAMLAMRASGNDVSFRVTRGVTRPVWEPDQRGMALYGVARGIARGLGFDIPPQSSGGGSDGNFTGAMGIATLDGLGVQGAGPHTLDEHILVDSLAQRGKLFAGILAALG